MVEMYLNYILNSLIISYLIRNYHDSNLLRLEKENHLFEGNEASGKRRRIIWLKKMSRHLVKHMKLSV